MKSKILILFLFMISINLVNSQTIESQGRFTNSIYAFEGNYRSSSDTSHVLFFQALRLTIRAKDLNNLSFHFSGRALTDIYETLSDEQRFRAYRLSITADNLFNNLLDIEIGRQFLHPGITLGSLDGAQLTFKFNNRFNWQIYGGMESHLMRSIKVNKNDQSTVYGTALKYRRVANTDIQLAYLQKQLSGTNQWQILGLNLSNYSLRTISFLGQLHYDFINSRPHRIYFSARYLPGDKWNFIVNVKQQYPQVYGDSYFKIFDVKKYSQAGLSAGYSLTGRYALSARYHYIKLEEGQGHRIFFTLSDLNGSIGLVYETGDLGNQLGVILDYGYEFFPNFIGSLSIDYSRYRFEEVYDYENQLANAVRVVYKFTKHWRVDLEYQWLTNRFRDSDHRVLNHIHYIW